MAASYGRRRSSIAGPLIGLLVCAALAFGFFHFQVSSRLGDLGAKALSGDLTPPHPIGRPVTVDGTDYRPTVVVNARKPVATRSLVREERVLRGNRLVAVPLSVRNTGDRVWDTARTTTVTLVDSDGVSHPSDPGFTRVRAGRVFPNVIKLKPGRRVRGVAVFELPQNARVDMVSVKVGPGFSRVARWQVSSSQ